MKKKALTAIQGRKQKKHKIDEKEKTNGREKRGERWELLTLLVWDGEEWFGIITLWQIPRVWRRKSNLEKLILLVFMDKAIQREGRQFWEIRGKKQKRVTNINSYKDPLLLPHVNACIHISIPDSARTHARQILLYCWPALHIYYAVTLSLKYLETYFNFTRHDSLATYDFLCD